MSAACNGADDQAVDLDRASENRVGLEYY